MKRELILLLAASGLSCSDAAPERAARLQGKKSAPTGFLYGDIYLEHKNIFRR